MNRLLVLAMVAVTGVLMPPRPAYATCVKPPAVAHRFGTERYPENSREAERWATDVAGARWLETDVQFDNTNTPFILHDETLDRTTNFSGAIATHNLSTDRTAGLRIDGGYYVPTLYEVLVDVAARPGVQIQLELKTRPTAVQMSKFLARLDWTETRSRVVVTSFDLSTLDAVKIAAPDLRRGLLSGLGWEEPSTIAAHTSIYSKHQWAITTDRLRLWRAGGLTVFAWTPDDVATWKRMASYGSIAGVVTNKPNAYRLTTVC